MDHKQQINNINNMTTTYNLPEEIKTLILKTFENLLLQNKMSLPSMSLCLTSLAHLNILYTDFHFTLDEILQSSIVQYLSKDVILSSSHVQSEEMSMNIIRNKAKLSNRQQSYEIANIIYALGSNNYILQNFLM